MPHLDAPMSALEAMDLSIREGRTVHLRWSPSLGNDLFNESEGGDVSAAGDEIEYWGPDTDRDGVAIRPWRVRLHDWGCEGCETWRVAAALALACGLDWGRWAAGRDGWCGRRTCPSDFDGQCQCASPPVADPSDVGAYRADCARRGVEPGPLPSLSWTSEDGRAGWEVTEVVVRVSAGWAGFWRHLDGPEWFFDFGATGRGSSAADLALLSTLVTAAAAALGHDHG